MSIYTAACSRFIFPLHERFKGHDSVAVRRRLERQERGTRKDLEEWRVRQLRGFLMRIGREVPYFRQKFTELAFNPSDVTSVADLQDLPLMDKSVMRAASHALKADGAVAMTRYNTGGSSGEPLVFYIGKSRKSHDVAAKWRVTRWWGLDIGDREIVLWGSPIELGTQDRIKQLRDRVLRSRLLPAFDMSSANLNLFLAEIRRFKPAMLFGYPSALCLLADHARARGQRMDDLGIKVAFVTSERLYDSQRATIGDVFGCRVANGYGARDAGFIAHECPDGQLHLQAEDIIVEICDADGKVLPSGEAGEIVVTHTATHEFPFVRYRTGDIGILSDEYCQCGRCLPILKEIQGRTTDFVHAVDGTVMHGLALIYTVRDLPGVEKFQIIQHSLDCTEVLVVAGAEFDRSAEVRIERDYRARLGESVDVRVTRVSEIVPEASGKFRYVISRIEGGTTIANAPADH